MKGREKSRFYFAILWKQREREIKKRERESKGSESKRERDKSKRQIGEIEGKREKKRWLERE